MTMAAASKNYKFNLRWTVFSEETWMLITFRK